MKIKKHILSATLGLAALGTISSSFAIYNTSMKAHDNDPVADQSDALNAWTKSINNAITVDMSGAQSTSDFSTLFQASFAYSITNFLKSPQGALWASEFSNDLNSVSAVSIYSLPTTDGTMPWMVNITLSLSNGTKVSAARQLMMNVTFLNLPTDTPSDLVPGPGVINPSNPALDQLIANYSYYTRYLQIQVDLSQYTSMAQAASAMQTIVANGLAKYATFWHISGFNLDPTSMRITLDTPIPSNHEGETYLNMSFELQLTNGQYVSVGAVGQIGFQLANTPLDPTALTPASTMSPARQAQMAKLNALQTSNPAKYNFINATMAEVSLIEDNAVLSFAKDPSYQDVSNYIVSTFWNFLSTNHLITFATNNWATQYFLSQSGSFGQWLTQNWSQNDTGWLVTENSGIGMETSNIYLAQENIDIFALFTAVLPFDLITDGGSTHVTSEQTFNTTIMDDLVNVSGLHTIVQPIADNLDGQSTYSDYEADDHIISAGDVHTRTSGSYANWASDANEFVNNFVAAQGNITLNETMNWAFIAKAMNDDAPADWTQTEVINPFANKTALKRYYVEICNDALNYAIQDSAWAGTNISISGSVDIGNFPDWTMFQSWDHAQSQFINDGHFFMNFNNL